MCGNSLAL